MLEGFLCEVTLYHCLFASFCVGCGKNTKSWEVGGRPHGIQMTLPCGGPKYLRTLCWQGTHQCSAFLCPNFSDCARLEMLQPISVVEMGCSESFVGVRRCPRSQYVMGYLPNISKISRFGSLRCVRAQLTNTLSVFTASESSGPILSEVGLCV